MTEPTDSTTQAVSPPAPQTKRISKPEAVRRLSDSAPLPQGLQATMELQKQIEQVSALLGEASAITSHQRQQMLDMAVLLEPIPELLAAIEQRQRAQDERLAKIEAGMNRVMAALSPQQQKDGRQTQPRLALSRKQRLFLE
jgi:hypothetical protein